MENDKDPFKRKRPIRDIDDIFRDFWADSSGINNREDRNPIEEQMKRMQQFMNKMINESGKQHSESQDLEGPWFYGFTYSAGTNKEPTFQEFGNLPDPKEDNTVQLSQKHDPYIDIQEEDNEVYVTIEIPGVSKENINLKITADALIVDVNHAERGFHKSINLPANVQEKKSKASYNNGILHIILQKVNQNEKGKNITIE